MQFMKNHATKFFTEHRLAIELEKEKRKKKGKQTNRNTYE